MAKSIQIQGEMPVPHRETFFPSASNDETNEGPSISARDPDTILILIVLLLACLALALLADVVI
jgi:hypothetical protein